jgi:hypothetical protein
MKKIMFNDRYGLTQAVLDGKKTMTRRENKKLNHPLVTYISEWGIDDKGKAYVTITYSTGLTEDVYPAYQIGEEIAIAQPYKDICLTDPIFFEGMRKDAGWRNKMFVGAKYMPHSIRITDIKVEKLQDISIEDCEKEGIIRVSWRQYLKQDIDDFSPQPYKDHHLWALPIFEESFIDSWAEQKEGEFAATSADVAFAILIDRISGKGTWMSNPWVFAYTFELQK